jgi:LemA protein
VTPLYVIFGALALVAVYFGVVYNRFVRLRNRIDNAWAQINVLLKRRADLIPNLLNTVKGYAAHERGTFEDVTRARAASQQAGTVAEQARAENAVTAALGRLFAVSEAYPQLQAEQEFKGPREQLAQTESPIAAARTLYNDDVLMYENARETIPTNIVAWFLGFGEREYFAVGADEMQNPSVEFGSAVSTPTA